MMDKPSGQRLSQTLAGSIYTIYANGVPIGYIADDLEWTGTTIRNKGFKARPLHVAWKDVACGFQLYRDAVVYIVSNSPYGPLKAYWPETQPGEPITCSLCGGDGYVSCETARSYGRSEGDSTCPACDGKGWSPYKKRRHENREGMGRHGNKRAD